jgi:predicted DNA binding CopG/RHH family protein
MIITKDSRIDLRINGNLKENIRQVAYNNGYTLSNYLNKMIENEVSSSFSK